MGIFFLWDFLFPNFRNGDVSYQIRFEIEDVSGWRKFRDGERFGMEDISGCKVLSCRTFCNWNIADRDLVYIRDDFVIGRFAIGTFVTWTCPCPIRDCS